MIKLSKSDVVEFVQVLMLANTPLSLFNGMVRCSGIEKLRMVAFPELSRYFDALTARAERSEVVAALAYAVLCAAVLQSRTSPDVDLDVSRLQWGSVIWESKKRSETGTGLIILPSQYIPRPRLSPSGSPSNDQSFGLVNEHGQPL